ncbi:MAG TPA: hypothetical protein VFL56_02755 [Solirubrobacterales bacterium]|nr:hypothetical protein [Solirubrobacterales bacterium]
MSFPIRVLLVAEDPAPARELEAARLEGRDGQVTWLSRPTPRWARRSSPRGTSTSALE